jgi:hypothetical protein
MLPSWRGIHQILTPKLKILKPHEPRYILVIKNMELTKSTETLEGHLISKITHRRAPGISGILLWQ